MEENETNGKEVENNAVRPKSDMDAEAIDEVANTKYENENGAAAAKNILEVNDEVSNKDVEIRRLVEERINTSKGEKQRLKDLCKQKKMHQRQEKSEKTGRNSTDTRRLQRE